MNKAKSPELKHLEEIMKLMQKYQIDSLKMPDGIELIKTVHLPPALKVNPVPEPQPKFGPFGSTLPVNFEANEDVLFAQSSAPALTLEEFNNFVPPPKDE